MRALGIDVGGTFTDGVLVELPSRTILRAAKTPTDRGDLAGSVLRCFRALSVTAPALLSRFCISTTLATNAMVEGTRKDVCAVCIGLTPQRAVDFARETVMVEGGHDAAGLEVRPLDLPTLRAAVRRSRCTSFAISSRFGVRNPEHEVLASTAVLQEAPDATVVRGSDLVGILGMEERLFLAAKNAELIHLMKGLVQAINTVTNVPESLIYVLKGDGSMVSTEEATQRPIMTVLSGPAASATGGGALAGVKDALIIDIGGTTTDIALLQGGRVRLTEDGAKVGGSRLRVPSVDVTTVALGGDTEIVCSDGRVKLGHRSVRPICLAPDAPKLMEDRSFLFPVSGKAYGITPTDLFRAEGRSEFGDRGTATIAINELARACGRTPGEIFVIVEEAIRSRLLGAISTALTDRTFVEGGEAEVLLRGGRHFRPVLRLDNPVVGIGAPVRPFLELLFGTIECEVIVPERYEVGNAVGAACAGVFGRREVSVRCEPRLVQGEEKLAYHITVSDGQKAFQSREEAVEFAVRQGRSELEDYMERSRVKRYRTNVEVRDIVYVEYGVHKLAETVVSVVAEEI